MSDPLVIVGSGLAGYTLAREFRKLDKTTPLLVLSRDDAGFYSKPMLSNALAGGKTPASLVMKSAAQMAQELNAEVVPRAVVLGIDPAQRTVRWSESTAADSQTTAQTAAQHTTRTTDPSTTPGVPRITTRAWSQLVLAVGADPIRLPIAGGAASHIRSVNDLDDFALFQAEIEGARRVVILGAGLIGCEFANDLLARGIEPVVVDPMPLPLGRLLPEQAGTYFRNELLQAGVNWRAGVSVERVESIDEGERLASRLNVHLTDGSLLQADAVLSAVGLRPRLGLAREAGLMTERGILVDRWLRTTAPGIHALGDCAEVQHEGQGHVLPFVMPLMQQARALAATLAGQPTPVSYPAMPVTVKTPACPTVVCPPAPGASVEWRTEVDGPGCTALARSADGALQGFALLGTHTARKQELVKQIAPLLG